MKIDSFVNSSSLNTTHLSDLSGQKRHKRLSFPDQVFKTLPQNYNDSTENNAFKRKPSTYLNNKKPLTIDTIFSDSDSGSTQGDGHFVDSDYASLSVTPSASDYNPGDSSSQNYQCCVWDWRTTHIGGFMKKHRLRNLKKRLDSLGSVKHLPTYECDVGKAPSQKTTKRSKYNPHQECFVTDVSHRSRRCVIFRKRRHSRAHGPINDGMLQRVQVPVDSSHNEPRAEYILDANHIIQLEAIKQGLNRAEIGPLRDTTSLEVSDEHSLKINRLPQQVSDFLLNSQDGKFWVQLNCKLWNKSDEISRKDENNRHLTVPPVIVLKKDDFAYILSLLETTCFNEMHNMLLEVLNVPNQDKDNDFCEICQSESSEQIDPIVFCEGCELAVHQNCFGITELPKKGWYCRVCSTFGSKTDVRCRFCPLSWGTMKQTGDNGWGHFACSVWQQSLRFEDLTTFEPITHEWDLNTESFTKICSVCDLCFGSCITCSVPNCKIPFHPTCGLRAGLYMHVEDNNKSKIGVKLFSFCAYHSDKAKSVKANTNNRMEFILDQLNMGTTNMATECYKKSQLSKLEHSFDHFVNWRKIADEIGLSREIMEQVFCHWVKRRRANHNRPLVCPYEANDKFISTRFRDEALPKVVKKPMIIDDEEDMEEVINEYAKAHCILDKFRNLATLSCRREKLKLQSITILREAFEQITSHLEEDSHLSSRYMEKIAFSLQDQICGPGRGTLVSRSSSTNSEDTDSIQSEENPRKRGRQSDVPLLRSPKSRRTASFSRPFNKTQEVFAELFDLDETLKEEVFKAIPADCV